MTDIIGMMGTTGILLNSVGASKRPGDQQKDGGFGPGTGACGALFDFLWIGTVLPSGENMAPGFVETDVRTVLFRCSGAGQRSSLAFAELHDAVIAPGLAIPKLTNPVEGVGSWKIISKITLSPFHPCQGICIPKVEVQIGGCNLRRRKHDRKLVGISDFSPKCISDSSEVVVHGLELGALVEDHQGGATVVALLGVGPGYSW